MSSIGIDISQNTFDATMITSQGTRPHRQFANTQKGFQQFHAWVKPRPLKEFHVCMEATNIYWEELAEYLFQAGYPVSVVNPSRTKGFAISQLQRNKTDNVDSGVIADFCERMTPRLWQPPSPERQKLRALVRHLEALKKTRTQQLNRLKSCRNATVKASFDWSDVGSWAALHEVTDENVGNNVAFGEVVHIDAEGNLVYAPEAVVTLLGVDHLAVVHTGDVILVASLERSQDVKLLRRRLTELGLDHLL